MAAGSPTICSLPLDILLRVFSELPAKDRASLPYVCKTWAVWLKTSGELYRSVNIDLSGKMSASHEFMEWMTARVGFTEDLRLLMPPGPVESACDEMLSALFRHCASFQRLQKLTTVSHGRFHLPPGVQYMTCLQRLNLIADSTLEPLPRELSALSNLKTLHVEMEVAGGHRVAASFLPIDLLQMIQLTELSLSKCGHLNIPITLYELSCLERLSVRQCQGVQFAQGTYVPSTTAAHCLKRLSLAFCDIHSVPLPVGQLDNLEELDLEGNQLSTLPSLGLKKLQLLNLAGNRFKELPRLLFRLPALRFLDLSNNPRLSVHESEPDFQIPHAYRLQRNLNTLLGRLGNLEVLNLKQPASKVWEPESKEQLLYLKAQMQHRKAAPSQGPLKNLRHVYINVQA